MYGLKTDWPAEIPPRYFTLQEYEGSLPRWCPGCGDHGVLTAVQRLCRDEQLEPEKTVFVSGIGCASRFPHYMKAYGFHGLHGRALPVACGIRARRPDLHVFVATGDGDCCSIGAAHWVHAVRYNMNMVLMLLDNNVYGLTKNQTSPTSLKGRKTNTHPRGAWLEPIDPIQTTLGIQNASFVAQTVDWNPPHVLATLKAAHRHPGMSFVRILQRCPHYPNQDFVELQNNPAKLLLLTHADGIEVDDAVKRMFKNRQEHDPSDLDGARRLADREDAVPVGLFYRNDSADRYDRNTVEGLATSRRDKIAALEAELSRYEI
ncbi:MAG: 2-oxoglutarate oxidoreductase [Deltaproteobacteria bacterium]|nr:MAG: 2-oxoglutarate oxidoreductase [Deltaproteobacteria bacterium]